jgi:hypothetical protein
VLDQLDDVAAGAASSTIPNRFLCIDRKPIPATTQRAWPNVFLTDAFELDAAAHNLVHDWDVTRPFNPSLALLLGHGTCPLCLECLLMTRRLDCMRDLVKTDMVETKQGNSQTVVDQRVGFSVPIARNAITSGLCTRAQTT